MAEHHVDIYHCQQCGRVLSREHDSEPPLCCGERMARAVANITYEDDSEKPLNTDEVIAKSHHSIRD